MKTKEHRKKTEKGNQKILILNNASGPKKLYDVLTELEDIEGVSYEVLQEVTDEALTRDYLSGYDLFIFFSGQLHTNVLFQDKKKIICISSKEIVEESSLQKVFIINSAAIEATRHTAEDRTLPALVKQLLTLPLSAEEKQMKAKKEMEALEKAVEKEVIVSLIKDGHPTQYSGELIRVIPYSLVVVPCGQGTSYVPFVGTNIAITKIVEKESGNVLYENDTVFPEEEWSFDQMNLYRTEKWGNSRHNPIIV